MNAGRTGSSETVYFDFTDLRIDKRDFRFGSNLEELNLSRCPPSYLRKRTLSPEANALIRSLRRREAGSEGGMMNPTSRTCASLASMRPSIPGPSKSTGSRPAGIVITGELAYTGSFSEDPSRTSAAQALRR